MLNKKIINSAKEGPFKDIFVAEDLTPMRARLCWYIKEKLSDKFCNVHTLNGSIKIKTSENDKTWIVVNNPDDLFAHLDDESDFDIKLFNKGLHSFKILPQLPVPKFADVPTDDDTDVLSVADTDSDEESDA